MDLLIELIMFAVAIAAKLWPVILAFLGYRVFDKLKRKVAQSPASARRMEGMPSFGGTPRSDRKFVYQPPRHEERPTLPSLDDGKSTPVTFEPTPFEEPLFSSSTLDLDEDTNQVKVDVGTSELHTARLIAASNRAREGMKWALIFSPPRAKEPFHKQVQSIRRIP